MAVEVLPPAGQLNRPVLPIHTFHRQDVYVWKHEQGTLIEMENEEEMLKRFNKKRVPFKAWPIAPLPGLTTSFTKSWLILVKIPRCSDDVIFPCLADHFSVDFETRVQRSDGVFSLVNLNATRIHNPYEELDNIPCSLVPKCAAFKVDVPRSWRNDDGANIEMDLMSEFRISSSLSDIESLTLEEDKVQNVVITWDTFSLTFEAELAALRRFVEQPRLEERELGQKAKDAFKMILNFQDSSKAYLDLQAEFPHLRNPTCRSHRISSRLLEKFKAFNKDHRSAYDALTNIPNGLFFLNGCPGAGKTEWNMILSALIQSKRRPGQKKWRNPILFVVDLNKTVDDAADRYFNLCKEVGLNLRIVRMHGWPHEMRNSSRLNKLPSLENEDDVDFTKKFLTMASLAQHGSAQRNLEKAPTLDEAAWDYFEKHKQDCFIQLRRVLKSMEVGDALSTEDWKALRSQVSLLYRAVLAQTDFIATTPVAAYGSFSKIFEPAVIFIDEAPHARELTSLIPLAFFDPIAWIFTGDVKQTRPFVKGGDKRDAEKQGLKFNPHAEQLKMSLMARAELAGAINSRLLVNKRAHGNLHLLPSKMFYEGKMLSGYSKAERYPPSVLHLKAYLERLGGVANVSQNRVIVRLNDSEEEMSLNSFWNPTHQAWILNEIQNLLKDPNFQGLGVVNQLGRVMIQTPYSLAARRYLAEVKRWPQEWQDRVEVMTVDKAQGNQADMVFLDMVRTTKAGFMNESQRLNVSITRARQAEVILMHPDMAKRFHRGRAIRAEYTSQIWEDAAADGRVFEL